MGGKREGNTHPEEVIQTCPEMVGEGDYLIQVGGGEGQKCAQEPGGGGGGGGRYIIQFVLRSMFVFCRV